jgi:nitrous oxidase accessory protein NosD
MVEASRPPASNDFLTELRASVGCLDPESTDITLDVAELQFDSPLTISQPLSLRSSCRTKIACPEIIVKAINVSLSGLELVSCLLLDNAHMMRIADCEIHSARPSKDSSGAFDFTGSRGVTLTNVTIRDIPTVTGMYLRAHSSATGKNVTVTRTQTSLVAVIGQSKLALSDSTLQETQANGIFCVGHSSLELRRCSLSNCKFPAVYADESSCVLEDAKFTSLQQNCVSFKRAQQFVVRRTTCEDVGSSAIVILDRSVGEITDCEIARCKGNGIHIQGASTVTVARNVVRETHYPGLALLNGCRVTVADTRVSGCSMSGFAVRRADDVTIEGLTVTGAAECGLSVSDTKRCVVTKSVIRECKVAALECYNGSSVTISDSECIDTGDYAFQAFAGGNLMARNNTVRLVKKSLCRMTFQGGASSWAIDATASLSSSRGRLMGTLCSRTTGISRA